MKKLMSFALLCLMSIATLSAQGVEEVTLVVSGDGATKEEATHVALRSAIEQAYGTFVSANTAILNDSLVKDEVVTISSGNIQKYTELACMQLENGKSYVSLQATVSLTQLVKYAQSKGAECEFAGATFGANVKLYELNKANTEKALQNIQTVLENTNDLFDYVLKMGEARITSANAVKVPYTIRLYANQNTANFYNYMNTTLKSISYTEEQIQPFEKMGYDFGGLEGVVDIDLQWGKNSYSKVVKDVYRMYLFYKYDLGAQIYHILKSQFENRICNVLLNDNIDNTYPALRGENEKIDIAKIYISGYNPNYPEREIAIELNGVFPIAVIKNDPTRYSSLFCYVNVKDANSMIGAYMGKLKGSLNIPIETLSKISNFYLTKKDGSPVPTTTISSEDKYLTDEERVLATIISSEDKKWAGTPPVSLTAAIEKIDGIPVCTDTEYDLGDIKRGSSASVIFRLGSRDDCTYMDFKISNFMFNGCRASTADVGIGGGLFGMISPITFKKIENGDYHYVRVTYKPSKGFLASTGPFRAEISINMQKKDGGVDTKTVEITGNIK